MDRKTASPTLFDWQVEVDLYIAPGVAQAISKISPKRSGSELNKSLSL